MIDLTGQRFEKLIVLKPTEKRKYGGVVWLCRCDCGNFCEVVSGHLKSGNTKSCGCLRIKKSKERATTHGCAINGTQTSEYGTWCHMKGRCLNSKDQAFYRYGGRGIIVCDRWLNSFENFLEDMGKKPRPGLSIERINNDGNYEPGNCKWATSKEQRVNSRSLKPFIAFNEKTGEVYMSKNQKEFGKKYKICGTGISMCLHDKRKQTNGWIFQYMEV